MRSDSTVKTQKGKKEGGGGSDQFFQTSAGKILAALFHTKTTLLIHGSVKIK